LYLWRQRRLALALGASIRELQEVKPDEWFRDFDWPAPPPA
jgi:hypothetical protein